jgi:hypothetical protein
VVPQVLPELPAAAAAGGYDTSDQLYAGSQAQSDSLIMMGASGTDDDSQVRGAEGVPAGWAEQHVTGMVQG